MGRLTRSERLRGQNATKWKKRREKGQTILKKVTLWIFIKAMFLALKTFLMSLFLD